MSIEWEMPSNHLILYYPLLLPPSIFLSIRVFSSESVLCIRWPKYWSFSFSISPSNGYLGLISFRVDWLDLLAGTRITCRLLKEYEVFEKAVLLEHLGYTLCVPLLLLTPTLAYSSFISPPSTDFQWSWLHLCAQTILLWIMSNLCKQTQAPIYFDLQSRNGVLMFRLHLQILITSPRCILRKWLKSFLSRLIILASYII